MITPIGTTFRNSLRGGLIGSVTRACTLSTHMNSNTIGVGTARAALANADPEQARLMSERVILVDTNDKVIGSESKVDSHLIANDLPLHRAFSLFLFDTTGRMLLQKRAAAKVTFPSHWTNTVCSHPLYQRAELGDLDNGDPARGTARAAVRKISHELGAKDGDLLVDDLLFLTRIHYRAHSEGGVWGEHELDYVFFAQKDVSLDPQPNEVESIRYVSRNELRALYAAADRKELFITPWFKHIVDNFGWKWWDILMEKGFDSLKSHTDTKTIHRLK